MTPRADLNVRSRIRDGWCVCDIVGAERTEASSLLAVADEALLRSRGWDFGFWTVLDEACAEQSVALIGHQVGAEPDALAVLELEFAQPPVETLDAEAIAAHGDRLYVVGSHFVSKERGVDIRRGFIARFSVAEACSGSRGLTMQVARDDFRLHRLVNDALASADVLPLESELAQVFEPVRSECMTRASKHRHGERWRHRLDEHDWPLNIEGAAFTPRGSLLLGLRFPVSADGNPLVVELDGVDRLFDDAEGAPAILAVTAAEGIGDRRTPLGVRDLDVLDGELHLVAGALDSEFFDYEDKPAYTHWALRLDGGEPRLMKPFPDFVKHIEGLATTPKGAWAYACDEDDLLRVVLPA